jgi:hypothetical protein
MLCLVFPVFGFNSPISKGSDRQNELCKAVLACAFSADANTIMGVGENYCISFGLCV